MVTLADKKYDRLILLILVTFSALLFLGISIFFKFPYFWKSADPEITLEEKRKVLEERDYQAGLERQKAHEDFENNSPKYSEAELRQKCFGISTEPDPFQRADDCDFTYKEKQDLCHRIAKDFDPSVLARECNISLNEFNEVCVNNAKSTIRTERYKTCVNEEQKAEAAFFACGKEKPECKEQWGPIIEKFSHSNCVLSAEQEAELTAEFDALLLDCLQQYSSQ